MKLNKLSNIDLMTETEKAVAHERASTSEVIRHLQEINRRKLYLDRGFPSLYEMVTKHFGYCAGSAMRRINSMRLVNELPEVEAKIESGELSLTAAATVQSFLYSEAKVARPYSRSKKMELVETCLNLSSREVERELCKRSPEREKREDSKRISDDRIRVSFTISDELNAKLENLKRLLAHVDSSMSTESLIERLAELGLEKYDPARKANRAEARKRVASARDESSETDENRKTSNSGERRESQKYFQATAHSEKWNITEDRQLSETGRSAVDENIETRSEVNAASPPAPEVRSRYIPASEVHKVNFKNAGLGCDFVDEESGRRCGSHHLLQKDHVVPFAEGGEHHSDNLRMLCAAHNRLAWRRHSDSHVRCVELAYG